MASSGSSLRLPQAVLSAEDVALFLKNAERSFLPKDTVVIREGEPGREMFVLLEGELSITVQGIAIDHLTPGMILGEMALVDDRPRSATATAAVDSWLVAINRDQFLDLLRDAPEFAVRVMNIMSIRTRRLIEEEVKRQRMEEELAIGRRIQLSLLPRGCPQIPGYELAAGYRAAREVGGDLYDFVVPPDAPGTLHLIIADVTGKGVPAALYMAVSRTLLHTFAIENQRPADVLRRVNAFIRQDETSPLFLSAFYTVLDVESNRLTYANAGHNLPLWLHAETGELTELAARGLVLGAFEGFLFEEQTCTLETGDFVVFYTDGITEARNAAGDFLDDEGLVEIVRSRRWTSAQELMTAIILAVDEFTGPAPQADDFTVVVLRRTA